MKEAYLVVLDDITNAAHTAYSNYDTNSKPERIALVAGINAAKAYATLRAGKVDEASSRLVMACQQARTCLPPGPLAELCHDLLVSKDGATPNELITAYAVARKLTT